MRFEKILFIIIFVGLSAAIFDLATKIIAIVLLPDFIVTNNIDGGNYLFPIGWSFAISTASLFFGIISLAIAKDRLSASAIKSFSIGLGFILGALIQLYETLAFPVIDFIPVHSYLLLDFLQASGWGLASFADLYKPIGIIFMCYGTLKFIRESASRSPVMRSCYALAQRQKSHLDRLVWGEFAETLPCP